MGLFTKREKTKFIYDEEGKLVPVHYIEKRGEYIKVDPEQEAKKRDSEKIKRWIKEDKKEKARLKAKQRAGKRREWEEKKRRITEIRRASMTGAKPRAKPRLSSQGKSSKTKYVVIDGKAVPIAKPKTKDKKKKKVSTGLDMKEFKWPKMSDWKL